MKMYDAIKEKTLQSDEISPIWKRFIMSDRKAIIYGAGRQARILIDFCHMYQKEILCLMTTQSRERWGLLPREDELPLFLVQEFPENYDKNDYDVVIALGEQYSQEVHQLLEKEGFKNVYQIKSWEKENSIIRNVYYRNYFLLNGARLIEDINGEEYIEYPYGKHILRMYFPKDKIFSANILGELGNIVMPSIFGDESVSCLGPYEKGENIQLHEGDTVFDLGASVGLFSCVAAAKGCSVYAFEPGGIPVYSYLEKNAYLNPEITVVPYAVGSMNGECSFYINDKLDRDSDMCQSSVHPELNPAYCEKKVQMITLDNFVKENNIAKVDFIKSHIEYAEDDMLLGAQETLRRDAPILSFYSQKALGNNRYKKIEELIKSANPNYKIYYYKRRIYAYVLK